MLGVRRALASRTERLQKLRKQVAESGLGKRPSLVGPRLKEAGLLDRAVLNREIEAIFEEAAGGIATPALAEQRFENLVLSACKGQVRQAAEQVTALLGLDLDDLRKAALLSLMVRLIGKRKFDPIASYILEKRSIYVTGQG